MNRGIKADPNIDFSQMDVKKFYNSLFRIIGNREGVTIKYTIERREDV